MKSPLRVAAAELVGTALLVAVVVGSGIAARNLTDDAALQLLCNALATGAGLVALILTFGPVSAAFNPLVSVMEQARLASVIPAQIAGACVGAIAANVMFGESVVQWSAHERVSGPHLFAEAVATFGLLLVIAGTARRRRTELVAVAVGGYITAAYFFTSSTSFANPAVTIGRMFSNTFAGISPSSVLPFIAAQCVGAALAIAFNRFVFEEPNEPADRAVSVHP